MSDYLCEALIVEIFTLLPPKSLVRFRSLSKSWYFCIGSPGFIRMHTFRSTQKLFVRHQIHSRLNALLDFKDVYRVLVDDFYTLHSEDELPLCPTRGYNGITAVEFPCSDFFSIVGSCDGIFCLNEFGKDLSLWNPSIRHKISIPYCPRISIIPFPGIGFGFDPISDDYKIVMISYDATESSYVYALKTGSWCVIASPTPFIYKLLSPETCFFNGASHWVVDSFHTKSHHTDLPCIMTFDLSTHVFGMIPLPGPFCLPFCSTLGLTSLQGSLTVIYKDRDHDSCIWVRRDGSWSRLFKFKANQFGKKVTRVLQLTTNSDLLLNHHVYNIRTGKQSRLMDFDASSNTSIYEVFQYVESLHLLDTGTACEENLQSVSGGKETSEMQYLIELFYYIQIPFKLLFNMIRCVFP